MFMATEIDNHDKLRRGGMFTSPPTGLAFDWDAVAINIPPLGGPSKSSLTAYRLLPSAYCLP